MPRPSGPRRALTSDWVTCWLALPQLSILCLLLCSIEQCALAVVNDRLLDLSWSLLQVQQFYKSDAWYAWWSHSETRLLKIFPFNIIFFLKLHVTVHLGIEFYLFHYCVLMVAHAWYPLLTEQLTVRWTACIISAFSCYLTLWIQVWMLYLLFKPANCFYSELCLMNYALNVETLITEVSI